MAEEGASAWATVGEDGVAALIDAVLELDPDDAYTEKELAAASDASYRELYLADAVAVVAEMGLLDRREDAPEDRYEVAADGDPVAAAREFATAVGDHVAGAATGDVDGDEAAEDADRADGDDGTGETDRADGDVAGSA